MAAVAAEPGAAAVPTTTSTAATDDEGPPEPGSGGPGLPGAVVESSGPRESGPAAELVVPRVEDGGDGEERRHVRPELEPAAGKALCENAVTDELINNFSVDRISMDRFSPGLPADAEGGGTVSGQAVYRSILSDPQPSAVFLHSFPAPPPVTEAGLSLAEPAEPTTNVTTNRVETAGRDRGYTVLVHPELGGTSAEDGSLDGNTDRLSVPGSLAGLDPDTGYGKNSAGSEEPAGRGLRDSSTPCRSPKRRMITDPLKQEKPTAEDNSRPEPGPESVLSVFPLSTFQDLSPGSEVRVCLDHVIDDALVVSFRRGEKVFSGVLMDVSKRFGPYGIPITVFPRRDDRNQPQTSLLTPPVATTNPSTKQEEVDVSPPPPPPPQPWTSKPPPLFQEGAPYPPPLFIRDTYNQALPQPPPRKIKRPKRRYRCEEPTSIMNAIKLRPRQVLCDKCKGVVTSGGHREARRGPVDLRGEEASRRRKAAEGPISAELKRLRGDDKGGRATDRRSSSGICVSSSSSSSSSSRRVLRGVASSSASSPSSSSNRMRLKLNSKKGLAKGSAADRSKARQVLKKLARNSQPPQHRRPKDQNQSQTQNEDRTKAVTRAAALQNHNQKVHFTRRLQHLSGSAAVGASAHTALPPRMRLKPQRYRTDEQTSSPPSKQSAHSSPPKPAPSPPPASDPDPPPPQPVAPPSAPSPSSCEEETQEVCAVEEATGEGEGGDAEQAVEPPPPSLPSSSPPPSLDSESNSTQTFEPPPTGDLPSSSSSSPTPTPAPPPPSLLAPPSPPSSSPVTPPPRADSEEMQGVGEEEEGEEGGDLKRRRKSSTSSSSSSTSSSSSVFSKSVSKCSLPDGRTVCVGDIVWAKIYGFPWWPARVLGITVARRGDTGLAVRQEARVSWFGSPTTSFLPLAQLSPFLETFQSRFDRKRKGPYRRAIAEAASAAKQLTPEVRALLTQFET